MISEPTVFILGAGASIPYGYPSGAQLVQEIYGKCSSELWLSVFRNFEIAPTLVNEFKDSLYKSQKYSIDAFLEHRPEFLVVGKIAIAMALSSHENPNAILSFENRGKGIYQFLYNSLFPNWVDLGNSNASFITFNYDRSLEYFLFTSLKNSYNKPDAEIANAINGLPIIHVHGTLGPLLWQSPQGSDYSGLLPKDSLPFELGKKIKSAVDNIKVVSESNPQNQEFIKARELIRNAKRVYFLGFGYLTANLERLGFLFADRGEMNRRKKYGIEISGTAMGLGKAQVDEIQNNWGIKLPSTFVDALAFLREFANLS